MRRERHNISMLTAFTSSALNPTNAVAATPKCRGERYPIFRIAPFTLDPYLKILCVKQGGIKYHFFSFWYDSSWD